MISQEMVTMLARVRGTERYFSTTQQEATWILALQVTTQQVFFSMLLGLGVRLVVTPR